MWFKPFLKLWHELEGSTPFGRKPFGRKTFDQQTSGIFHRGILFDMYLAEERLAYKYLAEGLLAYKYMADRHYV